MVISMSVVWSIPVQEKSGLEMNILAFMFEDILLR